MPVMGPPNVCFRPRAVSAVSIEFERPELDSQMVARHLLIDRSPSVPNYSPFSIGLSLQDVDVAVI